MFNLCALNYLTLELLLNCMCQNFGFTVLVILFMGFVGVIYFLNFNHISYISAVETDFSSFLSSAMTLAVLVFHLSLACEAFFLCPAMPADALGLSQVILLP